MYTDLINVGDSANWYPQDATHGVYTFSTLDISTIKCTFASPPEVVDPKLERQYNLARVKNNKNEMRRLEALIVK